MYFSIKKTFIALQIFIKNFKSFIYFNFIIILTTNNIIKRFHSQYLILTRVEFDTIDKNLYFQTIIFLLALLYM